MKGSNDRDLLTDEELLRLARSALADVFPNPGRIGCPDRDLRFALAVGRRDLRQHWDVIDHICICSPCFVEQLAFRRQHRRRRFIRGATGGAILCLALTAAYFFWRLHSVDLITETELLRSIPRSPRPPAMAFVRSLIEARLDLSHSRLQRSGRGGLSRLQPVRLMRGNLSVQIYLPRFSAPGRYRIILRRDTEAPLIDQSVRARIRNGDTVLDRIHVDTGTAAAGTYSLTVQRAGAFAVREFFVRID